MQISLFLIRAKHVHLFYFKKHIYRMDKEFLEDYTAKEQEEIEKYHKKILNGSINLEEQYPPKSRFNKINDPVGRVIPNKSIWPQIPLFGSSIVSLMPVKKNEFSSLGFNLSDID